MKISRVGIFDSGVGGLTVVKEIEKRFPGTEMIYLGDTARLPYGDKSEGTIVDYSLQNTRFLMGHEVDMVVVACNTSSAIALERLQSEFRVPVVGMIAPGAALALKRTGSGRIGLIGTRATIGSGAYPREIRKLDPGAEVFEAACPLFVPLVEEGFSDDPVAELVAGKYLAPLLEKGIDTLILGCTHYPLLVPTVSRIAPGLEMVSSGEATADHLESVHAMSGGEAGKGSLRVYVTDAGTHFGEVASKLMGRKIELEKVSLERITGL